MVARVLVCLTGQWLFTATETADRSAETCSTVTASWPTWRSQSINGRVVEGRTRRGRRRGGRAGKTRRTSYQTPKGGVSFASADCAQSSDSGARFVGGRIAREEWKKEKGGNTKDGELVSGSENDCNSRCDWDPYLSSTCRTSRTGGRSEVSAMSAMCTHRLCWLGRLAGHFIRYCTPWKLEPNLI